MQMTRDNDIRYAEFMRIVDGDTFTARIHIAPKMRPRPEIVANIRVANWDAAELSTEEGRYMRRRFEEMLVTAGRIDLRMHRMSFERVVCNVWLDGEQFAGILTHELLTFRRDRAADSEHTGGTRSVERRADDATSGGVDSVNDRNDQ